MIVPMQKYSFLVYGEEYNHFLKNLQELGVLHVIEKSSEANEEINKKRQLINTIEKVIKFLDKREVEKSDNCPHSDGLKIVEDVIQKQKELTELEHELASVNKEIANTEPWGDFSRETINKLSENGVYLHFFITSNKKFDADLQNNEQIQLINDCNNRVYFVGIQQEDEELNIDAEEVELPKHSLPEIKAMADAIKIKIEQINKDFDCYSEKCIDLLKRERDNILASKDFQKVIENTEHGAEGKIRILEGWVPDSKKQETEEFLNQNEILYTIEEATTKDDVPILLKNNKFSKLFEPIGKLFSLPSYAELDLTVFFAPFFMMFFGFCLGDAGYGLLFVLGAGFYKLKADKEIKPMLTLVQYLGAATILFGAISGTVFGINLIETKIEYLKKYKEIFLNPDNMFLLAIVLGGLQIIFGMIVKVMNQIKQFGIKHALATIGWLFTLIGGAIYGGLTKFGFMNPNTTILSSILSIGGFFILFFSDVTISIPARIGKGVWDIYSTVTGVFGDLLSYIRLFALGLSSGILGLVINDIGMQILGSSAIFGPIFFVIFLLLGHGLNIMISSLGSFVHPMRLTFVEFYKNAGFLGGGKQYKPFSKVAEAS